MRKALELSRKYKTLLSKNGINTPLRLAHLFAQLEAESGLKAKRESLYYTSVSRARAIFYSPFVGKSDDFVASYLRNSERMANYVYANRMGNGNECSGDGFRYRGGGMMQHTGRNEYQILKETTGVDYVSNPNLLINEADGMIGALSYWNRCNLNSYADQDNLDAISDIINIGRRTARVGDANGYAHRLSLLKKNKTIFK